MVGVFLRLIGRELTLAVRGGIGTLMAVVFFVITVTLFPLAVGPELGLLSRIAPGAVWVAALLAALLSLDRLFVADHDDGSLEQLMLGTLPLEFVVLAKTAAHWLTTGLPLAAAAPILALLLNMSTDGLVILIVSLLLGTPILSLIGAVGAALTVGLRRGGALIALLVLPLYVPVLIFGVGAVEGAVLDVGVRANLGDFGGRAGGRACARSAGGSGGAPHDGGIGRGRSGPEMATRATGATRRARAGWASIHFFANPARFLRVARAVYPWAAGAAAALIAAALVLGLYVAPPDYQQGDAYRIIFVHVPAAWMSLFVYVVIALCSAASLVWRHPLADLVAKSSAPVGAAFTFITLLSGSLWGQPMWGTWWVWDARLTSMLVLFFLYLGYIALHAAFDDPAKGARAAAILALVGVVNVPIVKFSVDWWNTLHQPATISKIDAPSIDSSMVAPLLLMAAGFMAYYLTVLIPRVRAEIANRRIRNLRLAQVSR